MKVIDSIKSRLLVEYVLRSKENIIVEKPEDSRIDFVITRETEKYGVFVRYRNFPLSETKSKTLDKEEQERILHICGEDMIPVIAYVFYEMESDKTYVFMMTMDKMEELSMQDNSFVNQVMKGIDVKLGVGKHFSDELYVGLKNEVASTEISINSNQIMF